VIQQNRVFSIRGLSGRSTKPIQLSARELGRCRLDDFCPRCYWLSKRCSMSAENPFHVRMPGVLSVFDKMIKESVKTSFTANRSLPQWLREKLGHLPVAAVKEPPWWEVRIGDALLKGQADALWVLADGSVFIAEYKMARLTEAQKALFPLYEAQLKAYAYLAQNHSLRVGGLALVYLEPRHGIDAPLFPGSSSGRLSIEFSCTVRLIESWSPQEVEEMTAELARILSEPAPPKGRENCRACSDLEAWLSSLRQFVR